MDKFTYPQLDDLLKLLRFSAESGQIWLGENRALLVHATAFSSIRKELITTLGITSARTFLTKIGYDTGVRDAEVAKNTRGNRSPIEIFAAGPQLAMLEGGARVTPLQLDIDPRTGRFYGEFSAEYNWEAESHLREFGHSDIAVCWMQSGYASGYTTTFMGRPISIREVECAACGSNHCTLVGKPLEEWEDEQFSIDAEDEKRGGRAFHLPRDLISLARQDSEIQPDLIGESKAFRQAYELIAQAAQTDVTVLLLGETGVGKERFARALHQLSLRKAGTFIPVNCAAIPHELLESELFGAERGAYTGATTSRPGKFERADGGTIFLDEVGDLPLSAQAKLLRVLQEGEVERLGDDVIKKIDIRVIAATNVNLEHAVAEGRFRSDLYFRLCVYPVTLPPLRERIHDIPLLVKALIKRLNTQHRRDINGITEKAMQALLKHTWPGNIRELENVIERAIILAPKHSAIELEHLLIGKQVFPIELEVRQTGAIKNRDQKQILIDQILDIGVSFDKLEWMILSQALERAGGVFAAAARSLGMTSPQLRYRIQQKHNSN